MGTKPNTSLILTVTELDYINRHFNGSKSAAIHAALEEHMERNTQYQAEQRISDHDDLRPYTDILTADWNEGEEHWRWVLTAPVIEIVEWAESIKRDEEDAK